MSSLRRGSAAFVVGTLFVALLVPEFARSASAARAESEPSPAPRAPKPALVPPPPFASHEGDPQLERSLAGATTEARRAAPYVAPSISCYTYRNSDPRGDTTGGIDAVGGTLDFDCVHQIWTVALTAAQPFGDNQLALFAANIDTDGNLTNHCAGAEYSVAVGWVSGAGLVARLFSWVNGCNDPGTGEPLSVRRLAGNEVDVSWVDGSIGSPTTFHWYDDVTGATNATGNQFDYLPNSGYYTATKTSSAAFSSQSAPNIDGDYTQIVPGDFNGDGTTDLLFYAAGTRQDYVWFAKPGGGYASRPITINGSYRIVPGDFNGDGTTDLLFYAAGAAPDSLWIAHHDGTFTSESLTINGTYQVVAGDFNGDGATDLFFYAPGVAPDYLWNGVTGGTFHPDPSPFAINNRYVITAADMNGDGRSDLVLYAPGTAPDYLWLGQANDTFTSWPLTINGSYAIVRAGDFNGDGADDLLFFNPDTGGDALLMGTFTAPYVKPGPTTVIDERYADAIVGNFDGDGTSDIIFDGPGIMPERRWAGVAVPAVTLPIADLGAVVVDSTFGRVYVTSPSDGELLELDLHGRVVRSVTGLSGADGLLLTGSTLYVALSGSAQIAELSHYSLTRTGTIDTSSVMAHPATLALAGGKLWIGTDDDGVEAATYDLNTQTIAASTLGDTSGPRVYASNDVPNRLFVFDDAESWVTEFDVSGSTPTYVASTPRSGFCSQVVVAPGTTRVFTACADHFYEHDASSLGTGGVGYSISATVAADVSFANGGWVVAAREGVGPDALAFRPGNHAVVHDWTTGCETICLVAIMPDGRTAYAVHKPAAGNVQLEILRLP